jgi:hypothetical protein
VPAFIVLATMIATGAPTVAGYDLPGQIQAIFLAVGMLGAATSVTLQNWRATPASANSGQRLELGSEEGRTQPPTAAQHWYRSGGNPTTDVGGTDHGAPREASKGHATSTRPSFSPSPGALHPRQVIRLRDLLLACPVVKDLGSRRQTLIPQIEGELGESLHFAQDQRSDLEVVNLVRACLQFGIDRGLEALVRTVEAFDGQIKPVLMLREYVDQLLQRKSERPEPKTPTTGNSRPSSPDLNEGLT